MSSDLVFLKFFALSKVEIGCLKFVFTNADFLLLCKEQQSQKTWDFIGNKTA